MEGLKRRSYARREAVPPRKGSCLECTSIFFFKAPRKVVFILIPVALVLLASPAARPEAVVSVTPARIPLKIASGEAERLEVAVINHGDEPVDLIPTVMAVREEDGKVIFRDSEECGWITVEGGSIHLAVSETRPVDFHVSVPVSVPPGLRRFALAFVQPLPDDRGIGITPGIAVLVEMEVVPGVVPGNPSGGTRVLPWVLTCSVPGALIVLSLFLMRRKRGAPPETNHSAGKGVAP